MKRARLLACSLTLAAGGSLLLAGEGTPETVASVDAAVVEPILLNTVGSPKLALQIQVPMPPLPAESAAAVVERAVRVAAADIIVKPAVPKATEATKETPPVAAAPQPQAEPATQAPPVAAAEPAKPLPPPVTLVAKIDLTSQRLTVVENGKIKHSWPISSAAAGYATPTGTFTPKWMAKMWYSRQYEMSPMPHSVFFNGGIAVHATQHVGQLGRPASHGCVRLAPANAATFYALVSRHSLVQTRVQVFGAPKHRSPASDVVAQRHERQPQHRVAAYGYQNAGYARAHAGGYGGGYFGGYVPAPVYAYGGLQSGRSHTGGGSAFYRPQAVVVRQVRTR